MLTNACNREAWRIILSTGTPCLKVIVDMETSDPYGRLACDDPPPTGRHQRAKVEARSGRARERVVHARGLAGEHAVS
jgi:hypothetical protein